VGITGSRASLSTSTSHRAWANSENVENRWALVTAQIAYEIYARVLRAEQRGLSDDKIATIVAAALNFAPVTRIAISRIGFGSDGENESALVSSQLGLPNFGSCNHGFHGPMSAPFSAMVANPWKLFSIPARISS
jgi:hypothetical protein